MNFFQATTYLPKILAAFNALYAKYRTAMVDGKLSGNEIFTLALAAGLAVADIVGFEVPMVDWIPESVGANSGKLKDEFLNVVDKQFADNVARIVVPASRIPYAGK